jgi:dTDP-glucose 4,6-dehydratase
MKYMIVTGGFGFIGSNFIHHIMAKEPDLAIINIDCLTYAGKESNLDGIDKTRLINKNFDLGWDWNVDSIKYIIDEYTPEWIVHFAAESHVDNSIEDQSPFLKTNIYGTIHLLEAIKKAKHKVKFLHMSTDEVYGSLELNKNGMTLEVAPFHPNSPYAASKAAAECFVMAYGSTFNVPYIITNCSNVYGPRQHLEKFIPKTINHALRGKYIQVYGNGENQRDWIYVDEVCEALEIVLSLGTFGEKYNIGTNNTTLLNNNQVANKIINLTNADPGLLTHVKDRPGHDLKYHVCSYKINQLGWKSTTKFDDGIAKTIDWFKVKK